MKRKYLILVAMFFLTLTGFSQKRCVPISKDWEFKQVGTGHFMPAQVPGCVHTDLLANKIIDDPFYRTNESNVQWIDKVDWEYRTQFTVDSALLSYQNIELDFKGLDTYAKVYLNDALILTADNMYREWFADCRSLLKAGNNSLRILFTSPITEGLKKLADNGFQYPASNDFSFIGGVGDRRVSVFTRKAPYDFGWDWGPRLVTSGIWRPINLVCWNVSRINNIQVAQKNLTKEKAALSATLEIESSVDSKATLQLSCRENKNVAILSDVVLKKGINLVSIDYLVKNPRLWWSNGLGEPFLYHFVASVLEKNKKVDEIATNYGIRTLRVVEKPDSAGTAFYFELNGHPVFAKGANYIPNDVFLDRVSPEKYEFIVKSAAESHMNMLRVWGGGIFENDIFYDLCDKYGIMLWHDFMFACSMYPGDSAFVENVRQEVVQNIKRLRNHPCIALWCGNNEMYSGWKYWGWQNNFLNESQKAQVWGDYQNLFHKMLPELVNQYDHGRFYWYSSPFGGWQKNADGTSSVKSDATSGDNHIWAVWHGKEPFTFYNQFVPRFASEYGFQSFPDMNTIETFAKPEDYDINSDVMKLHQRSGPGNMLIKTYMDREYKQPKDFPSFVYIGQLLQAEGVRTAIEAHRRNMPYCMGTLFWQINDCWQAPSWSSIDYLGHWKALQYYAREVMKENMISTYVDKGQFKVCLVSDKLQALKANMNLKLIDFNGKILWSTTIPFTTKANGSKLVFSKSENELLNGIDGKSVVFVAEMVSNKEVLAKRLFYFKPVKDLQLPDPGIIKEIRKTNDGCVVSLKTNRLAKNVFINTKNEGIFSDNYFDMLPGESKTIIFKTNKLSADFDSTLKILTVLDSF